MTRGPGTTILFIDHAATTGGSTKVLLNLLHELNRSTVEPIVACAAGSDLELLLTQRNIRTHAFSMPWFTKRSTPFTWFIYAYSLIRFGIFVAAVMRRSKTACVHANGIIAALYGILPARLGKVPLLWHMHDIMEQGRVNKFFVKLVASQAVRIICVSRAVRQRLLDFGVPEAKCEVVYNFISEPESSPAKPVAGFRAEFHIEHNARVVGMIGNICQMKGQMVFVEAVNRIAARSTDTVFVMVGDTITAADEPYKTQVVALIKASGLQERVILTGFRRDAFTIMQDFDILVHPPTLPESLGLVLLEAMYHGKPVIASDIGGIPEVVVNGVSGILVPPRDPVRLAQAIEELLDRPEIGKRLGSQGKRIASEKFDRKRIVAQLDALYQGVLSNAGTPQQTYYSAR